MHTRSRTIVLLSLLCLLALSPLLSACSAAGSADQVADTAKSAATQAAEELSQEPTEEPVEEPAEEAQTELENAFNNLTSLAPVHMSSSLVYKEDDEVSNDMSYEADVDANGNQHVVLASNSSDPVEIVLVDGKMYMNVEGDQYIDLGDVEDDAGFSFLAVYGGAYLLAFNDLQDATLVGHETIGPWQADKYTINMDLNSLGLGGLVAGAEGFQWDYSGAAWVEPGSGALVKAVVDWSGKGSDETQTTSWHSEFVASEGTVTEITAPENVLSMGS